jgi:hypothetical protein
MLRKSNGIGFSEDFEGRLSPDWGLKESVAFFGAINDCDATQRERSWSELSQVA